MKIVMLQVVTEEIKEYSFYTSELNASYCKKHGYIFQTYSDVDRSRHLTWSKVKAVWDNLGTFDVLFVLDADAYVQNPEVKIESFDPEGKSILVCENGPNGGDLLNTGAMIFYNTPVLEEMVETWWQVAVGTDKIRGYWHEQSIINSLHNTGKDVPLSPLFQDQVKVFDCRAFNSWWMDVSHNPDPRQFVQHIMGRPIAEKTRIIKEQYEKLTKTPILKV